MKRTQIYLTEEQRQNLEELASAQDTTMSHVIREAIDEYVTLHLVDTDPLLEIVGLGESGSSDGSVHHDQEIYGN